MDNEIYKIITESDNNEFVAGISILTAFATQINQRLGYYQHDEHSGNIRQVGEWLYKTLRLNEDTLRLFKAGAESEAKVEEMFHEGNVLSPEAWEMTWDEYYAFNCIVNRRVCRKIYEQCSKAVAQKE